MQVYYVHLDHLNTPRRVTDEHNTLLWQNPPLSEPFGLMPPEEDPDGGLASSGQPTRIPGGNSTTVRVDPPHMSGQQSHAHAYEKGCKEIVVNKDGTGSHGSDPSKLKNRVKNFLRGKGFKIMWCTPFLNDLVMSMAAYQCVASDLTACQVFQGMGDTIHDSSEI